MLKLLDMKLKNFFTFVIVSLFIGFGVTFYLLFNIYTLSQHLNNLESNRYKLTIKADELRQSSDDLTRFARTYVITADDKYRQNYFEVLDIRNGKIGRPTEYDAIYWDLSKELRKKRHPSTQENLSLRETLKKLPYSEFEFAKLKEAEDNSNDLVNLEVEAFNAMIGTFKDKNSKYTIKSDPNQKLAIELMHSKEYHYAKQKIMMPIDEFLVSIKRRTNSEIKEVQKNLDSTLKTIITIYLVLIALLFMLVYVIKLKLFYPINFLVDMINRFTKNPDLKLEKKEFYNDELGLMSRSFFKMNEKITQRSKELRLAKEKIEQMHQNISKSIEFSSLIQKTFISDSELIKPFCEDSFVLLEQRDTVGGDIILFEEVNSDECLFFIIDCTSHGVPGAFVTMIVKTLQRQILKEIVEFNNVISPSLILSIFNKEIKELLKQTSKDSISNVGFDGQILYYNKKENHIKFSSARNDILIYKNNELKRYKGDRHSVGYKDSKYEFKFKEHHIDIDSTLTVYMYSDGFTDQLGGNLGLPFGNKRLLSLIDGIKDENMTSQGKILIDSINKYKGTYEKNDDLSFVGLKLEKKG